MGGSQPSASDYSLDPMMAYQTQANLLPGQRAMQSALFGAEMKTQDALLAAQMKNQGAILGVAETGQEGLLGAQRGLLGSEYQNYADLLKMASQTPPQLQTFDAMQTSKEAAELGMANLARSRQYEQITNPQAAAMREAMGQKVADVTSDKYAQDWANQLFKRGIIEGQQTGLAGGTLGSNAFADQSLEQKRQRDLANLQVQQQYLNQNQAPEGGLSPGQLIGAEMGAKAANLNAQNDWMRGIYGGAENLLKNTASGQQGYLNMMSGMQQNALNLMAGGQAQGYQSMANEQQNLFNTMAGMQNQGYQNLLGLTQSGLEGIQNYGNMGYQSAANAASSRNALLGTGLGAGIGAAGMIGGAVII